MVGAVGGKNRNYPSMALSQALEIPRAIQEGASGKRIGKLALAKLVGRSPGASQFRDLLLASRAFGLTKGGVNGDEFDLTPLGHEVTSSNEHGQRAAMRKAVLNIAPYRTFLSAYDKNKVPAEAAFREFLNKNASVPEQWAEDCIDRLLTDARVAGLLDRQKTGEWVDLGGNAVPPSAAPDDVEVDPIRVDDVNVDEERGVDSTAEAASSNNGRREEIAPSPPRKVFVAHGKNRKPLEQLKSMLDELGVDYSVAVDEPHAGRPVSQKVAAMMKDECASAIFIFSADERFLRDGPDGQQSETWRPSENAIYELGAASVLYGRRIILFKDERVVLPSDFSDIGHIAFQGDHIDSQWPQLLRELKAHGIVEIRVAA